MEDEKTRISIPAPRQSGPKNSSLVQIYGPNLGQRYIIDQPVISLGRDESNDIVLADENVSRHHAEIILLCDQKLALKAASQYHRRARQLLLLYLSLYCSPNLAF